MATKQEKEVQVKKEVRKLRNYEESLVVFYTVGQAQEDEE